VAKINNKIGTYKERTLHAVLKKFFEPDEDKHEIKYKGYIADIINDEGISEIQTTAFNNMRKKLECFLEDTTVTVIFPAARLKWLIWIDTESGEITKKHKSPKIGNPYVIYEELYKIKYLLTNPNLRFKIVMVDIEEYRKLDGWSENRKKGSHRAERIPVDIGEVIEINSVADYNKIIPTMPENFTAKDFKMTAKISIKNARTALNVLNAVGAIECIGKKSRAYLYRLSLT